MTFLIAFGQWGGFRFELVDTHLRIVLGWVALWWINQDIEEFFVKVQNMADKLEKYEGA